MKNLYEIIKDTEAELIKNVKTDDWEIITSIHKDVISISKKVKSPLELTSEKMKKLYSPAIEKIIENLRLRKKNIDYFIKLSDLYRKKIIKIIRKSSLKEEELNSSLIFIERLLEKILLSFSIEWNKLLEREIKEFQTEKGQADVLWDINNYNKTVMDGMIDAISIIDVKDFKIVGANKVFIEKYGPEEKNIKGKTCYELTHRSAAPCCDPCNLCPLEDTLTSGNYEIKEHIHYTGKGKEYVEISTAPLKNEKGTVTHVVHIARDITERKLAEVSLNYRLKMEKIVTDISTRFINIKSTEFDKELKSSLKSVGEFVGVDRCYINIFSRKDSLVEMVYEWCAKDVLSRVKKQKGKSLEHLSWVMKKFRNFDHIHVAKLSDLPEEAKEEKKDWRGHGVKSILSIPLVFENKLNGYFGFNTEKEEKTWKDQDIRILKLIGEIFINAIERKRWEEELKKSEAKYRELTDLLPQPVFELDLTGRFTFANKSAFETTGYTREEFENGITQQQILIPEDRERAKEFLIKRLRGELTGFIEYTILRKDGTTIPVITTSVPIIHENRPAGLRGIVIDITERKKTEEALRASEARNRALLSAIPDLMFLHTKDGVFLDYNAPEKTHLLMSPEEFLNKNMKEVLPPEITEPAQKLFNDALDTGQIQIMIYSLPFKEEKRYYEMRVVACGEDKLLTIVRDITESKRGEEERLKLAAAIEQSGEFIIITDNDGKIEYVNPAFEKATDYTNAEIKGEYLNILQFNGKKETDYENIWNILKEGNVWSGNLINRKKDGTAYEVKTSISPIRNSNNIITNYIAVKRDVTEERKMEKQLRQSQKMEAIGTLAGGIAHDFNNILASIIGYTELMVYGSFDEKEVVFYLHQVLKACSRARDLIKQILAFSRQSEEERKPVQVSLIIKETLKLLRATLPVSIEIQQDIKSERSMILGDPTQIHQLIMNLCTNAAHAMREKGGILKVIIEDVDIYEKDLEIYRNLKAGKYLKLTVKDTGHGIPEEDLERIFEPYYTTKKMGEGTGMGLAVVHGIVKSYGGEITVNSELNSGTTFDLYLPKIKKEIKQETELSGPLPGGSEKLLLIDDEEDLIYAGQRILKSLGYEVTATTSSIEALSMFSFEPESFDLVITDQTMPHMTGNELAKEMLRIKPDIPIILCTGFSEIISAEKAKSIGIEEFILKPINIKNLAMLLRKVLDK